MKASAFKSLRKPGSQFCIIFFAFQLTLKDLSSEDIKFMKMFYPKKALPTMKFFFPFLVELLVEKFVHSSSPSEGEKNMPLVHFLSQENVISGSMGKAFFSFILSCLFFLSTLGAQRKQINK